MKTECLIRPLLSLMVVAVGLLCLCGCHRNGELTSHVIVQNERFTVSGDSVIEDTVFACVARKATASPSISH